MDASANALAAKAKAMYGQRLRSENYQMLLQRKSVAEIASYLKNETYFKTTLNGINDKAIHRGQLEALIRMDLVQRFSSLMRYATTGGNKFYRFVIIENEINQILFCVRSFVSGDKTMMVAKLPTYMEKSMTFNVRALNECHDFETLLVVLKDTPYHNIVAAYKTSTMDEFDFVGLEHALKQYYYEYLNGLIDKNFHGSVKKDLHAIISTEIELDNIAIIYRLKKYFQTPATQIKKMVTPKYLHFSQRELEEMIDTLDGDQLLDRLNTSYYKNYIKTGKFIYIEHFTKTINYNMNRHYLEFSNDPNVVLLAYMLLSENEIQNIVDIVEGVRYSINADHIKQLLIY